MNVGSPLYGVHFGFPSGAQPINPTTVPDVLRVMYYSYPWPQNTFTVFPYTGNSCSPTQPVVVCVDQWSTFNVSPSNYDRVSDVGPPPDPGPLFQDEGLQFDIVGIQDLDISNSPIQTGLTAFTAYLWGTQIDNNSGWVPLGNISGSAAVFVGGNNLNVVDDGFDQITGNNPVSAGKVLIRISYDGTTLIIDYTGNPNPDPDSTTLMGSTFSFNQVGNAFGFPMNNGDLGNRHMGQIIVARVIGFGSPEDLGIRAGIANGTYTGKGGYSL